MKKKWALILAVLMVFSIGTTVFAANSPTSGDGVVDKMAEAVENATMSNGTTVAVSKVASADIVESARTSASVAVGADETATLLAVVELKATIPAGGTYITIAVDGIDWRNEILVLHREKNGMWSSCDVKKGTKAGEVTAFFRSLSPVAIVKSSKELPVNPDDTQDTQNPPDDTQDNPNPPDDTQDTQNPPDDTQDTQNPPDDTQDTQNPPDDTQGNPNTPGDTQTDNTTNSSTSNKTETNETITNWTEINSIINNIIENNFTTNKVTTNETVTNKTVTNDTNRTNINEYNENIVNKNIYNESVVDKSSLNENLASIINGIGWILGRPIEGVPGGSNPPQGNVPPKGSILPPGNKGTVNNITVSNTNSNSNANTSANTNTGTAADGKKSDKTGETPSVLPLLAVMCVTGMLVAGRKIRG